MQRRYITQIARRVTALTIAFVFVGSIIITPRAAADYGDASEPILRSLGIYFTTNTGIAECSTASGTGSGGANLSGTETDIAKIIIGIAKSAGFGDKAYQAAVIGIMTALTESRLAIWASRKIPVSQQNPAWLASPKKLIGEDHYSVGVFQQQVGTPGAPFAWGTIKPESRESKEVVWQLMDPAYSAQAFFTNNQGASKGLKHLANWDTIDPWLAAQRVQKSYDSTGVGNYKPNFQKATSLVEKYWNSAQPVPLPVPIGSTDPATPGSTSTTPASNCPTTGGASGVSGSLFDTIAQYAWPEYRGHGYLRAKPAYATAVKRAQSKGEYIGACAGADCGGFVTRAMRDSGTDPNYNSGESNTVGQLAYLQKHTELYEEIKGVGRLGTSVLEPGDIAIRKAGEWSPSGHTYIYVGKDTIPGFKGNIAEASQCDRMPMANNAWDLGQFHWFRLKGGTKAKVVQ